MRMNVDDEPFCIHWRRGQLASIAFAFALVIGVAVQTHDRPSVTAMPEQQQVIDEDLKHFIGLSEARLEYINELRQTIKHMEREVVAIDSQYIEELLDYCPEGQYDKVAIYKTNMAVTQFKCKGKDWQYPSY